MLMLRQSTTCTVKLGPFYSAANGSALTGLTINQAAVRLSKNGGNIAQKNDSATCVHDELGVYDCALNATDTNTLGRLQVYVSASGGFVTPQDFLVVTANVYDTLFSTDNLDVNLIANQAAATIGTVTTLTNKSGFSLAADQSGVTVGAVTNLTGKTGFALSDAGVDAIWNEALSGHATVGTAGLTLSNLLKIGKNKWSYDGTTFTIYDDNETSALYQFTLDSATTPTSRTPV